MFPTTILHLQNIFIISQEYDKFASVRSAMPERHRRRLEVKLHTLSTLNFIPFTYLSGKPLASTGYVERICRYIPKAAMKRKTSSVPATQFNHSQ
jgi:hypothetical protein